MRVFNVLVFSAFIALGTASPASGEAVFMGLGDLPGGEFSSAARAVSADGSIVVGFSDDGDARDGEKAFRWENGVMTPVDGPPCTLSRGCDSRAEDVSANGSVIVGRDGPHRAGGGGGPPFFARHSFRWKNDVMTLLCAGSFSIFGIGDGSSFGVSADGSVVVGSCGEAFRWAEADGVVHLGSLGPGSCSGCSPPGSSANRVSADGSVVVGRTDSVGEPDGSRPPECCGGQICPPDPPPCQSCGSFPDEAFRWEATTGMVGLGDLPGGGFGSAAADISADGSVIVGVGTSDLCSGEAFRWEDGVMMGLGTLPGTRGSSAEAVSGDGSVVAGHTTTTTDLCPPDGCFAREAFVWNEAGGLRSLRAVLVDDFGLDLTGWTLTNATGISDDGLAIVGDGINPDGFPEGWIAVPEPDAGLLQMTALLMVLGLARHRRSRVLRA